METRCYPGSTHGHTEYSNLRLRDCIIKIDQAMSYAEELGHELIGFTDHEFVGSWIKIEKAAANHPKLKVIYGNEIYLCRNGLTADNFIRGQDDYYHFILLAKDEIGAEQIRQISTRAWKRSYMARGMRRVPTYYQDLFDIIGKNPGHVIGQTACLGGSLPTQLLRWRNNQNPELYEKIRFWCQQMNTLFGQDRFFLELQPSESEEQTYVNRQLIKLSRDLNIPYIITTDSHYLKKEDAPLHAAYLNAQDGEREVSSFYATTYMMGTEELESFMDLTEEELETAYNNIKKIGKQCENFSNIRNLRIPELIWREPNISSFDTDYWYSKIPMLKTFMESDYRGDHVLALHIVDKLMRDKTLQNEKTWVAVEDNLNKTWESSVVNNTHWSAYFLNLQKNIDVCWGAGTLVLGGRGCFTPEMKVTMEDGRTKSIIDVEIGERVFTHTGEIHIVKNKFAYDVKEELYRIKIPGTEDIICTNNHKILGIHNVPCKYKDNCVLTCKRNCKTKEKLRPEWIEAQHLSSNDMVAIPRYKYPQKSIKEIDLAEYSEKIKYCSWDNNYIYTYCGNNTTHVKKKYKRFIPVDKEFLYFLGVFIGDGWVKKEDNNRQLGLCFNSSTAKDKKSQERITQYLRKIELPYSLVEGQNGKQVNQVRMVNPFLGFFLDKECGHGAENKHIPKMFLYDNHEEMQELLWGLMNSDGNINKKEKRINYDTINFDLANQVRNLLSYLGVYSSIKKRIPQDNRNEFKNSKISYKVSASGKQLNIFPFIEFSASKNIVQRDDNYFYPRIKEITAEEYKGKVYDLSVEKDTSYVINNIAVHNSGVGFVLLYILDIIQINCLREDVQTYSFRFLNPSRVSVLDIDTDIEGGRRGDVLNAFRKTYGADRVANVATFRCEKPKAAILTACRGLEYNPEVGQYLSSLIPVERGESWTLQECMYGNEEKGRVPVKQFVAEMTQQYADVWEMASKIEGIVCGYGIHAGGVIFVDEPFEKSTALMRAPDGTIITQFDLHDDEAASLIKIDLLSVEAADKIHICLDLLCDSGYIERKPTLRETYENAIGIYNLEREAPEMWEMIWEHKINSLFQMEKESGIKGIALTKPKSVGDLAHLNSIIRLMAQEKGGEMPIDKYTRFKSNIQLWYKEMDEYGLTSEEKRILVPVLGGSYGICESQESFMQLVQIPECGGFDLNFADKLRKSIAKKSAKDYEELTKKYFKVVKEKGLSKKLCDYVWNVLIATSRGYGFKYN